MTPLEPDEAAVEAVLARAYRGIHHVPYWRKRRRVGKDTFAVTIQKGPATFDYDELTRLVVAAHDECVRVEIHPGGPWGLTLYLTARKRDGGVFERHPTIEDAIVAARKCR